MVTWVTTSWHSEHCSCGIPFWNNAMKEVISFDILFCSSCNLSILGSCLLIWYCITMSCWIFLYTILHNSWPGGSLLLLGCWLDTPTALIFQNGSWPCLSAVQLPGCCVMWRSICSNSHCVGNHRKSAATLKNRPRLEPVLCSKVCACDCKAFSKLSLTFVKMIWFETYGSESHRYY